MQNWKRVQSVYTSLYTNFIGRPGTALFGCLLFMFSCAKNIDLNLAQYKERVLVVDGQFTDLNVNNYVRLTWARSPNETSVVPVNGALIIVSNQKGDLDTLVNERLVKTKYDEPEFEGYYYSKKLLCAAGDKLHLSVLVGDNSFEADAEMPAVTAIDSVGLKLVMNFPDENNNSFIPLLYFRDPRPDKNFYMTQFCPVSSMTGAFIHRLPCRFTDAIWNVAILDDKHLLEYVNGLNINIGATPSPYFKQWLLYDDYTAFLYSLTEESYNYYFALIKGLNSDGGVYSPTPGNAPSNILGTAPVTGFFNASCVTQKAFHVGP